MGKNRKKELLPGLKNLLSIQQEAAKLQKEELKRKAAAEKAKNKTPKEKPEYTLSLDEIINYVREENPDSAHAIKAMLRFFAMEKQGWGIQVVKNKIKQIDQQTLLQQTNNFNAPVSQVVQEQKVNHLNTK